MAYATKSGIGREVMTLNNGVVVAAIVAVNAWGDIINADGSLLAASRSDNGRHFINATTQIMQGYSAQPFAGSNTIIGAIVTNSTLSKTQALKVAQMAHDGYARAIRPAHSLYDGDTIFAAATGEMAAMDVNTLGVIAAEMMERAIRNAVNNSSAAGGLPNAAALTKK